jgi:hypothetical protein
MRYNQLFSQKSTVTIPGDFSLHAGDVVFVDAKQLSDADEEINKEYGGHIYYGRFMSLYFYKRNIYKT